MKLKELCFYMEGGRPMVRVIHDVGGVHETVTAPATDLGNITELTVKLAAAIVKKVKNNV